MVILTNISYKTSVVSGWGVGDWWNGPVGGVVLVLAILGFVGFALGLLYVGGLLT